MTIDLLSATSDAFFALLASISQSDVTVGTNFKEGTNPPIIMLGTVGSEPYDREIDTQLERVSVEIVVVYRGTDKSELLRLMHLARGMLDQVRPSATGIEYDLIQFTGQTASGPGEDGVTHAGSVEFEVLAQPTD